MQTDAYRLWSIRIVTFMVFALAAASAAYWGLKGWSADTSSTAPTVVLTEPPPLGAQAVARALGGGQTSPAASGAPAPPAVSRYVLVGVVAGRSRAGAALISVDGQEAKPVRVGTPVDGDVMLQSVTARGAVLASNTGTAATFTLELPPLPN
jgi:general secretion pathway protein C